MTKSTSPAANVDDGLPDLNSGGSVLIETEHGLSVWRPLRSLKTSMLSAKSLDEFMGLLDRYVAFGDREDVVRHYWAKPMGSSIGHERIQVHPAERRSSTIEWATV